MALRRPSCSWAADEYDKLNKRTNMNIQRLRNLTTGRLHTEMQHVYKDLETITGGEGLMTHMLPRVIEAVRPWLRDNVTDLRFWDAAHDTTHTGEVDLPVSTKDERAAMLERYAALSEGTAQKAPATDKETE